MISCVDDAGIAAPSCTNVEEFVKELCAEGFELEIKCNFTKHLGAGIEERADRTQHMTQKGLIKKIVATTKLTNCKPNHTPTTQVDLWRTLGQQTVELRKCCQNAASCVQQCTS